jgi:hypothetical protein
LGGAAFRDGRGHNGHQHVPGNDHWDPGGHFDIDRVLDADPSVHRALEEGMSGPDVRALQVAINRRARRCGTLHVLSDDHGAERCSTAAGPRVVHEPRNLAASDGAAQRSRAYLIGGIPIRARTPTRSRPGITPRAARDVGADAAA